MQVTVGVELRKQGKHQAALEKYNQALPVFEATLGRNHLDVAATYNKYVFFSDGIVA